MDELEKTVVELAVEFAKFKPDTVTAQTKFTDDLGYDSIRLVSFVIALEEQLDIELEDSFLRTLLKADIQQVVDYLHGLNANK